MQIYQKAQGFFKSVPSEPVDIVGPKGCNLTKFDLGRFLIHSPALGFEADRFHQTTSVRELQIRINLGL